MAQRQSKSFVSNVLSSSQTKTKAEDNNEPSISRNTRNFMMAVSGGMETKTELSVSPDRCRIWEHHNRFYKLLDANNCADLISSFKTQGQTTACIVRKVHGKADIDFEIICGARRYWTAVFLGININIEVYNLTDHQAFLVSDAENKDRQDISDYERAIEYQDALGRYYDSKQETMAADVGMSTGQLSKYLALARLDKTIVSAFSDLRWLKVHHGQALRSKLQGPLKAKLLENAKAIKSIPDDEKPKDGAGVVKFLMSSTANRQSARDVEILKYQTKKNHPMLSAKVFDSGRVNIDIMADSGAGNTEIIAAVRELLTKRHK